MAIERVEVEDPGGGRWHFGGTVLFRLFSVLPPKSGLRLVPDLPALQFSLGILAWYQILTLFPVS